MQNNIFLLILAGAIGGVLGGMGLGGGTLLIPILTVFFNFSQHFSQATNLVAFIPMAIVAVIVHLKNRLIEKRGILYIIIPATLVGIVASLISVRLDGDLLKKCFGGFLTLLSIYCFIDAKKTFSKNRAKKNVKKN
jgi:uncharacterized membrane protein YfcA